MSGDDHIGNLIEDAAKREQWRAFVLALHEAAQPGGPLHGWAFHGTDQYTAGIIRIQGVTTTHAVAQVEMGGPWIETDGTHWGTPKVAAFYAEDLIEKHGDPDLDLCVVAVRISDLEGWGEFAVDGQTLDCPLATRLGRSEEEVFRQWEESAQDWQACWDVMGTLLVLAPVGHEDLHVLNGTDDLERLIQVVRENAAPAP